MVILEARSVAAPTLGLSVGLIGLTLPLYDRYSWRVIHEDKQAVIRNAIVTEEVRCGQRDFAFLLSCGVRLLAVLPVGDTPALFAAFKRVIAGDDVNLVVGSASFEDLILQSLFYVFVFDLAGAGAGQLKFGGFYLVAVVFELGSVIEDFLDWLMDEVVVRLHECSFDV